VAYVAPVAATSDGRAVCVYCSSSAAVAPVHAAAARTFGTGLAARGLALVWGGARVGLMGEVSSAVRAAGGLTIGIIPEALQAREIADHEADELVVTPDMAGRKAEMARRSDAFVALPGGFGTLEEVLEQLTLRLLGYHGKPILLVDVEGFWQPLLALFEHLYEERFARPESRQAYVVADGAAAGLVALDALLAGEAAELPGKWL
jgi:uncharacterized protein (TIGR00730 family)